MLIEQEDTASSAAVCCEVLEEKETAVQEEKETTVQEGGETLVLEKHTVPKEAALSQPTPQIPPQASSVVSEAPQTEAVFYRAPTKPITDNAMATPAPVPVPEFSHIPPSDPRFDQNSDDQDEGGSARAQALYGDFGWKADYGSFVTALEGEQRREAAKKAYQTSLGAWPSLSEINRLTGIGEYSISDLTAVLRHFCSHRINGNMSIQGFHKAFGLLREGKPLTRNDENRARVLVDRLFDVFDQDSNGAVDEQELLAGISLLSNDKHREQHGLRSHDVFEIFDENNDGSLSPDELVKYLGSNYKLINEMDLKQFQVHSKIVEHGPIALGAMAIAQIFDKADINADGRINLDEFLAYHDPTMLPWQDIEAWAAEPGEPAASSSSFTPSLSSAASGKAESIDATLLTKAAELDDYLNGAATTRSTSHGQEVTAAAPEAPAASPRVSEAQPEKAHAKPAKEAKRANTDSNGKKAAAKAAEAREVNLEPAAEVVSLATSLSKSQKKRNRKKKAAANGGDAPGPAAATTTAGTAVPAAPAPVASAAGSGGQGTTPPQSKSQKKRNKKKNRNLEA